MGKKENGDVIQLKFCLIIRLFWTICLCLISVTAEESYAATYYVSPTGNNNADGSSSAPWGTFAHAMSALKPGDTLIVKPGIYNQQLAVNIAGTSSKPIRIFTQGYEAGGNPPNDGDVIISTRYPTSALTVASGVSYVEIGGFTFRNGGAAAVNDVYCATNGSGLTNVHGISIGAVDHLIMRRITVKGASGCNSANFNLAGTTNSLFEDIAASGQGRINLNALNTNHIVFRRVWMSWTGPSTGGGDTPGVNQIYDSNNIIMENCYGTSPLIGATVGGMGTWAHYTSISGNQFLGNIMYLPQSVSLEAFSDTAECGQTVSGTIFSNNVAIATYTKGGGSTFAEINANPSHGTAVIYNTFVGNGLGAGDLSNKGMYLSVRSKCRFQSAATATVYNNSFVNLTNGFQTMDSGNQLKFHDYNNLYNVYLKAYDPTGLITNRRPSHEKAINPAYNTTTYGYGAYLMVPAGLKGRGQAGADIGATVLYEYQNAVLTATPLWPWPMESRIFTEFGISPTWSAKGGLWKTLNNVYKN